MKHILGSKVRQSLLGTFVSSSKKEFYLRELVRLVDNSPGNTAKELNKLETEGILKSRRLGNLKFYQLNEDFFLLAELKSIVNKTVGIEAELRHAIKTLSGVKFAFIFGSYAKGGFGPESDLDVFVIGDIDQGKAIDLFTKSEQKLGRAINFHTENFKNFLEKFKENFFFKDIIKRYILITDNADEFRKFIKKAGGRCDSGKGIGKHD